MDAALFLCYNLKKSVNYERKKQMSDLYSELLVKKKQTGKDLVVKYGLIALTVIMVLGLFSMVFFWFRLSLLALHAIL